MLVEAKWRTEFSFRYGWLRRQTIRKYVCKVLYSIVFNCLHSNFPQPLNVSHTFWDADHQQEVNLPASSREPKGPGLPSVFPHETCTQGCSSPSLPVTRTPLPTMLSMLASSSLNGCPGLTGNVKSSFKTTSTATYSSLAKHGATPSSTLEGSVFWPLKQKPKNARRSLGTNAGLDSVCHSRPFWLPTKYTSILPYSPWAEEDDSSLSQSTSMQSRAEASSPQGRRSLCCSFG